MDTTHTSITHLPYIPGVPLPALLEQPAEQPLCSPWPPRIKAH